MAIADGDLSIAANGNIRWTGNGTTQYTVLELHRWLQDKADDALASGDDLLDISDTTPSDRSTDNIVTLLSPYNIDDATAQHFYDGSITQSNGDVIYAGLVVVGSTEDNDGTELTAFITDDGGTFADDTTDANSAAAADVNLLPATAAVNDAIYIGMADRFVSAELNISTGATGTYTLTWEYYDGSGWVALQNVTDGTTGLQTTGTNSVSYDMPIDWATTSGAGVPTGLPATAYYYIRGRVSAYTSGGGGVATQISVTKGTHLQIVQNNALITNYWGPGINSDAAANILLRTMVKTRTGAADIDGQRLRIQARELGNTYAEFLVTMGLGNNTAAIFTSNDLNNATAAATISGWSTITNVTEGYNALDVNGDSVNEFYYSEWDRDIYTINQLYERTKWLQRRGSASTLYGLNGELFRGITHEIDVDTPTGTFTPPEALSWSGGTGQLLAIDSTTAATKIWIQLLTGSLPADNATITGGGSSATVDADLTTGTITARTVSPAFIGASTGSAIIGAYGVGIETADLTSSDQLFDLTNTLRVPPNNVTFSVFGLVSGEDYVLVTNDNGGAPDKAQMDLTTTLSSATETSVVVDAIPVDTPQSGSFRVVTDARIDKLCHYSSWTGSTFTLDAAHPDYSTFRDFSGDNATSTDPVCTVYLTYIDQLADSTESVSAAISNETGVGFTDETTDANSAATGDVTLLPTGTDADEFYVGRLNKFNVITFNVSTPGVGAYVLTWEYSQGGASWAALSVTDNTTNFKTGGSNTVTFTAPSDWATDTVNSQGPYYYVRAVADTASRSTAPIGTQVSVQEVTTTESVTITYNADRTMFVRVRDGGTTPIKTFETTGTLGSAGGSSTAIRTSDL